MKKSMILSVSALALIAAPVYAAESNMKTETGAQVEVDGPQRGTPTDAQRANPINAEKVENDLEQAGTAIEKAAEDVGDAINEAYRDMRDYFRGDQGPQDIRNIEIAQNQTARGMIGQPVKDVAGKRVGSVHDIIVDRDGNARMVVVSDGGILGLGKKKAAFDYDVIIKRNSNGDIISTLSPEAVSNVAEFSYDTSKQGENVKVMPAGGFSAAKILNGKLLGPDNNAVADVNNIVFRDGQADMLIVAFNKVLGLGGQKAVMNYDEIAMVERNGNVDFRLTAQQASRFQNFKETASN